MHEGPKGQAFRRRYWARSYLGYPSVRNAQPNPTHFAIAGLEYLGHVPRIVTQNVDGLHHKASPFPPNETEERILQLHGTLHMVHCRKRHAVDRQHFQSLLSQHNPAWKALAEELDQTGTKLRINPDGDVEMAGVNFDEFVVPNCERCLEEDVINDVLKPDVVFFGESIAEDVKERAFAMVNQSDRVLLVGTTLATYSAFRLVKLALDQNKPVLMINLGPTRADGLVEKIEMPSKDVLLGACRLLGGARTSQDETLAKILSNGVVKSPELGNDDQQTAT